jgi:hypothetical protein
MRRIVRVVLLAVILVGGLSVSRLEAFGQCWADDCNDEYCNNLTTYPAHCGAYVFACVQRRCSTGEPYWTPICWFNPC